jgi:hypothetical protein
MLDHARKPAAAARRTSSVVIRRTPGTIAAVLLAGWAFARHAERRLVARGAAGS